MVEILNRYWAIENEAVDYLFLDYIFYIIFNESKQANDVLKGIPDYSGDVLDMQRKLAKTNYEISDFPLFNKLSWKEPVKNSIAGCLTLYQKILLNSGVVYDSTKDGFNERKYSRKIKSALRHFCKFVDIKRIEKYGFGIQFYEFINVLLRTSNGRCAYYFAKKHQKLVLKYVRRYCE